MSPRNRVRVLVTGLSRRSVVLGGLRWQQRESPCPVPTAAAATWPVDGAPVPTGHCRPTVGTPGAAPTPRNAGTDQGLVLAAVRHRVRQSGPTGGWPARSTDGSPEDKSGGGGRGQGSSCGSRSRRTTTSARSTHAGDAVFAGTFVISRQVVKLLLLFFTFYRCNYGRFFFSVQDYPLFEFGCEQFRYTRHDFRWEKD